MNNQFSDNLKKIRKENNLSQEQLADLLGVSRQAVSKWESSTAYPEMDKILALCEKFDMNIDDLLHKDIKEIKGEEESKKKLNQYIDDFLKFITDSINMFCDMSFKSRCKCITEQVIIGAVLLAACVFLGFMGRNIVIEIIFALPDHIANFIYRLLEGIYILLSFMGIAVIMAHVFKTRYLNYYETTKEADTDQPAEERSEAAGTAQTTDTYNETADKKPGKLFGIKKERIVIRDPKHSEYRFITALSKGVISILKLCVLAVSSLLFISLVCLFVAFALSFVLWSTGLLFTGLVSAVLSAAVINVIFILIALNFVFNRKNDKKKMIWAFIVSLMVFGAGCGMTMAGVLNLEFVTAGQDMMTTEYMEFEMKDDLVFICHYDTIEYIESDNENIRVESAINKYFALRSYENDSMVTIWAEPFNHTGMIKETIKGLKDKKVISTDTRLMDVKVYTTKENIEKLEKNYESYRDKDAQLQHTIDTYESRIARLEEEKDLLTEKEWEYQQKIAELESHIADYQNSVN